MCLQRKKAFLLIVPLIAVLLAIPIIYFSLNTNVNSTSEKENQELPVIFDFDTGEPILSPTQNTPLNQTSNGITVQINSPSDSKTPAFSIQNYQTTFIRLSKFSGNYIYDNHPTSESLILRFDHDLTKIKFTFATVEGNGGPGTNTSKIVLKAYHDTTNTAPIGETSASGVFDGSAYPEGTLFFESPSNFNVVSIEVPYLPPNGAKDFFIDNIGVQLSQS